MKHGFYNQHKMRSRSLVLFFPSEKKLSLFNSILNSVFSDLFYLHHTLSSYRNIHIPVTFLCHFLSPVLACAALSYSLYIKQLSSLGSELALLKGFGRGKTGKPLQNRFCKLRLTEKYAPVKARVY